MPLGCQGQQTPKWFLCPMYQGLHVVLGPCGEARVSMKTLRKSLWGPWSPAVSAVQLSKAGS